MRNRKGALRAGVLIISAAVIAACQVTTAPNPTTTPQPRSSRTSQSQPAQREMSRSKHCDRDDHLTPDQLREREDQWTRLSSLKASGAPTGENTEACSAVRQFYKECSQWDASEANVEHSLCSDSCPGSHRDRQMKWKMLVDAQASKAPLDFLTTANACATAQQFARDCPSWNASVASVVKAVCELASNDCAPNFPQADRKAAAPMIRPKIDAVLRMDLGLATMRDPNDARASIERVRSDLKMYRCYDEVSGAALEPRVEQWANATEVAISEEITCRASDECMARRIGNQICATLADRREAAQQVATERRNPGGVVDLQFLHDLGERIQLDDGTIARMKSDYQTLAKKAFTERLCKP